MAAYILEGSRQKNSFFLFRYSLLGILLCFFLLFSNLSGSYSLLELNIQIGIFNNEVGLGCQVFVKVPGYIKSFLD